MDKRFVKFSAVVISIFLVVLLIFQFTPLSGLLSRGSQQVNQPLLPRLSGPAAASGSASTAAGVAQSGPQPGIIVGRAAQQDISQPLREIKPILEAPPAQIREMPEPAGGESEGAQPARPFVPDPVLQNSFGSSAAAPAPSINFEGVGNLDSVYPPDTNGDVGPNHYVQWINLHFQIWNKSGVSLYGPAAGNTLWSGFGGPCQTQNSGDPIALYDRLADRWVMAQFTSSSPYGECVAVSTTPDPTGSYYRYFFQFSTSTFYDYPKLGVWPDGYYLTANRFAGALLFSGASAIVLNRSAMLNGQAAAFQEFQTSTSFGSLLPANFTGPTSPPAGEPNFVTNISSSALNLWKFHVDWNNSANSTFTGPTALPVAAWNQLCSGTRSCIPQPGTSVGLDSLGDRLMYRLTYRNYGDHEALAVTHSVNVANSGVQAGLRWYEVRNPNGTPIIYQQGTFAPDTTNRWMGSIGFDASGDMAIVYSVSSSSVFPGIRYTGRLVSDPLGQLPQGESTLIDGSGSQTGSASRWGDYASMSIDPVDDCTFWFTTEYMVTTGTAPWHTRVGSFKFPSCSSGPLPSPTPTATATNTPTPTSTPTPTVTPTPTNPPPAQTMHVNSMTGASSFYRNNQWQASVTILAVDASNTPLSGVQVSGNWSNGASGSSTCTTGSDGKCTVTVNKIPKSTPSVTFTVTNLVLTGYTYDPGSNTVSSIVVNHP